MVLYQCVLTTLGLKPRSEYARFIYYDEIMRINFPETAVATGNLIGYQPYEATATLIYVIIQNLSLKIIVF